MTTAGSARPVRLVLVGPPGAGKGTQAEFIAEHFGIPKLSTGDIFRANVSGGTELGKMAKKYMDDGDLVPDEVTNAMVRDRLGRARLGRRVPARRVSPQRRPGLRARRDPERPRLDRSMSRSSSIVEDRRGRSTAFRPADVQECGHIWHVEFDPPEVPGICDICGGELFHRDDDYPATVRHRLDVYAEQT